MAAEPAVSPFSPYATLNGSCSRTMFSSMVILQPGRLPYSTPSESSGLDKGWPRRTPCGPVQSSMLVQSTTDDVDGDEQREYDDDPNDPEPGHNVDAAA